VEPARAGRPGKEARKSSSDPIFYPRGLKFGHGRAAPQPIQTDGFEFVEYAVPDPEALGELFERMGFQAVAPSHKDVLLYKQGERQFIVTPSRARSRRTSPVATAERLRDGVPREGCRGASDRLLERGAWAWESRPGSGRAQHPRSRASATSLIYLVDRYPENRLRQHDLRRGFQAAARVRGVLRGDAPGPAGAGLRATSITSPQRASRRMRNGAEFIERLLRFRDAHHR